MRKPIVIALIMLVAVTVLLGNAAAQQPPATNTSQPPAAKPQTPPVAKKPQATTAKSTSAPALVTQKDKDSYALGMKIAADLKAQGIDVEPALVARGIKDSLSGAKPLLTDDEAKADLTELQGEVRKKAEAARQQLGEANMKEGTEFLAANKTKDGVVTLPSGLQYKILTAGTGPKPAITDTVVCQYRGTLISGTEFDSSYKRGQPATFPLNRVIKGWTEALQLMPVGSKWQLFIPPDLAYGDRGAGGTIGPNATLIFEVELVSIQGK